MREYPNNRNYLVDSEGNIYSKYYKNKKLTPKVNWDGYHRIQIWKNNKCKMIGWHRVVAETWVDNPNNKPFVNHIDGDKTNNNPNNLEWVTQKENIAHAVKTGLITNKTRSQLGNVGYYDVNGELLKIYDCIKSASDDLDMSYYTIYANIKNNRKLRNGKYFKLYKKCND